MLPIVFPVIFLFLLELSISVAGNYSWFFGLGAVVVSLIGIWRVNRQRISLPVVFFSSLLSILFLNLSHDFLATQFIVIAASVLFSVILYIYSKRLFLPIIFIDFLIFLVGIFLALIYQTANNSSQLSIGLVVFFFSTLLFFSSICFLLGNNTKFVLRLLLFSLAVGFIIMEFYFALSSLPFNFASIDFLVFIIYYVLWDLTRRYFSRQLTKKSLIVDICAILISFIAIFLSAKWFP